METLSHSLFAIRSFDRSVFSRLIPTTNQRNGQSHEERLQKWRTWLG